jgi:MFS family permease
VNTDTSIWSSLRNPTYFRLWLALVVSGCCVSAHEMAATWAMNSVGASALTLSLMSTAATTPFFLFTLPAGALADLADRRRLLRFFNGWLACSAGFLAVCAYGGGLTQVVILLGVFLLGTGFAFQAPVASAAIPEIVGKDQLPSAIALGGIQMNLAGIIGPAIGGLLIPLIGVGAIFTLNAAAFVLVLTAVMTWKRTKVALNTPLEGFFDSLTGAIRYMHYAPGVQVVLLRNLIFGILIGAIPALLPVIGLKVLHLDAVSLGLVFTSMGLGSLGGAVLILEPARKRLKPNQMTIVASLALTLAYALMATVRHANAFFLVAAAAGVAWTVSASELWVAGQRIIPDWIRGRMNATHMMVSQGGMAIAGLVWGSLAVRFNVHWALLAASLLGVAGALTAKWWSIDFSTETNTEPEPLTSKYSSPYMPDAGAGPITASVELEIAPEKQVRFFQLMKHLRLIFLRNGALNARLDQDVENPNRFRLQATYSSWVALERTDQRFTRDENALWTELWALHSGPELPHPKRYLAVQHWLQDETAMSRLKPTSSRVTPVDGTSAQY